MKIDDKKFVELDYTLTVDGEVIDQSSPDMPFGFVFGEGSLIPGFEKNIKGKKAGDKLDFTLAPEEAYGESHPEMIADVSKEAFMINGEIESGLLDIGNQIPMLTEEGTRMLGRVIANEGDKVKMDFNHPLAGKKLHFTAEILNVRDAVESDYSHHHHHDGCGDESGCGDCCGC